MRRSDKPVIGVTCGPVVRRHLSIIKGQATGKARPDGGPTHMRIAIIAIWAVSIAIIASAVPSRAEAGGVRCVIDTPNCGWVAPATGTDGTPVVDARG